MGIDSIKLAKLPGWILKLASKKKSRCQPPAEGVILTTGDVPNDLITSALRKVLKGAGRNEMGFRLACQLRDSGVGIDEAKVMMDQYVQGCPQVPHPYTPSEAIASLHSAYSQPRRPLASGMTALPVFRNGLPASKVILRRRSGM